MLCSCCGFEIGEISHKIGRGYVCEKCWNDPNNFFPEKMQLLQKWGFQPENNKIQGQMTIKVSVIKIRQKNVTLYAGKLKSNDLLKMYSVCGFEEESFSGYQRELYEEKINDIYEYLLKCPVAVMPAIFISLRNGACFQPLHTSIKNNDDFGTLNIILKKGSIWVIDGQHRVGGFEKILGNFPSFENLESNDPEFMKLMDYELPVIFIDSNEATEVFNHSEQANASPMDVERTIFFIINKTQTRMSSSLKDALQYSIKRSGVNGIPIIEREEWRTKATSLIIRLNNREDSPFFNRINISGARGIGKPIQLYSFVSSLKPLFQNEAYLALNSDEKLFFLITFWETIKNIHEEAFKEKILKEYLILKTIGIYSLNMLCSDYLSWCRKKSLDFLDKKNLCIFLKPIISFDWKRSTSPIAHFGGLNGVNKVHSILIQKIQKSIKL